MVAFRHLCRVLSRRSRECSPPAAARPTRPAQGILYSSFEAASAADPPAPASSTAAGAAVSAIVVKDTACAAAASKEPTEERFRALNELTASTQACSLVSEASGSSSEAEDEPLVQPAAAPAVLPRPTEAPLCGCLFFYDPEAVGERGIADASSSPLLRAEFAQARGEDGDLYIVGTRRRSDGGSTASRTGPTAEVVEASADSLIVDTRVDPEDDPCLVCLAGARLRAGRVGRLRLLACGGVFCEAVPTTAGGSCGDGALAHVPLERAVKELRERQLHRRNAELREYQRRLCAKMMAPQRRQFLDLAA